jgi:hypothetical protein
MKTSHRLVIEVRSSAPITEKQAKQALEGTIRRLVGVGWQRAGVAPIMIGEVKQYSRVHAAEKPPANIFGLLRWARNLLPGTEAGDRIDKYLRKHDEEM